MGLLLLVGFVLLGLGVPDPFGPLKLGIEDGVWCPAGLGKADWAG